MQKSKFIHDFQDALVIIVFVGCFSVSANAQQNSYRFSLEPIDDHAVLTIQTAEPLPCIGYSIRNKVHWDKDTAVVVLSGFVKPIPCVQGFDAASTRVMLKQKSRKMFYLKFQEDAFSNIWKISVDRGGFRATPIQNSFTSYSK